MPDYLPKADKARINPRKLRDYILSAEHETGRYKAVFFAQMGYSAEQWQLLEEDIRTQHLSRPVNDGKTSPYGYKYTITAPLRGPNGEVRQVTTVWIIRPGKDWAELVTIEPATRRKIDHGE